MFEAVPLAHGRVESYGKDHATVRHIMSTYTHRFAHTFLFAALLLCSSCQMSGRTDGVSSEDPRGKPQSEQAWYATRSEASDTPLELTIRPGRTDLPPGREFELPVVVDVTAPGSELVRAPLAISLVFDQSGSMKKRDKLAYTVQAAKLLIENLTENDSISVVAFGTQSEVLVPQQPATRKLFLSHWADEIEAGGRTNISAGLTAGIEQVRSLDQPDAVARVILLTDGLANRGIVDRDDLVKLVSEAAELGISVSTIGVGKDFDEDLLADLATAGNGHFTLVQDPKVIPATIAGELQGLLPVVHRDVQLTLDLPESIARGRKIICGSPEDTLQAEAASSGGTTLIELGDFVPGERKTVVLWLQFPSLLSGSPPLTIMDSNLASNLMGEEGERVTQEEQLRLTVAETEEESETTVDMSVMDSAWLAEIFDLAHMALKSHDDELIDLAIQTIEAYDAELSAIAERNEGMEYPGHAALVAHFGEELAELREEGLEHGHDEASEALEEDLDYRRYLLMHHKPKSDH